MDSVLSSEVPSSLCPRSWFDVNRLLPASPEERDWRSRLQTGCWSCTFLCCCLPACFFCYWSRTARKHHKAAHKRRSCQDLVQVGQAKITSTLNSEKEEVKLPSRKQNSGPEEVVSVVFVRTEANSSILDRLREDLVAEKEDKEVQVQKKCRKYFERAASIRVDPGAECLIMSSTPKPSQPTDYWKEDTNNNNNTVRIDAKIQDSTNSVSFTGGSQSLLLPWNVTRVEQLPSGEKVSLVLFERGQGVGGDVHEDVSQGLDLLVLLISNQDRRKLVVTNSLAEAGLRHFQNYWTGFFPLLLVEVGDDIDIASTESLPQCFSQVFADSHRVLVEDTISSKEFLLGTAAQYFAHLKMFQCTKFNMELVGSSEGLACSGLCRLRRRPFVRKMDGASAASKPAWRRVKHIIKGANLM